MPMPMPKPTSRLGRIAILWRGNESARRSAAPETSRFAAIFAALAEAGVDAEPVVYEDDVLEAVRGRLASVDGVLVWVNPIREGRNREALADKKAAGAVLGGPKLEQARALGTAAVKAEADRFASNVAPIIESIRASGIRSMRGIARALTARGVHTARGGEWTAVQVSDILRRVGEATGRT